MAGQRVGFIPPRTIDIKKTVTQRDGKPVRNLKEMLTYSPWKIWGEALRDGQWHEMKWRLDGLSSIFQMENAWDLVQGRDETAVREAGIHQQPQGRISMENQPMDNRDTLDLAWADTCFLRPLPPIGQPIPVTCSYCGAHRDLHEPQTLRCPAPGKMIEGGLDAG